MFSNNCHYSALGFILVGDADVYHTRDPSVITDEVVLPRALLTADLVSTHVECESLSAMQ